MERVIAVCRSRWTDIQDAVVVWADRTERIQEPGDIYDAVRKAISSWVQSTDAGRAVYEDCEEHISIGRLNRYRNDPDLARLLTEAGLLGLVIRTYVQSVSTFPWDLDEDLAGEPEED